VWQPRPSCTAVLHVCVVGQAVCLGCIKVNVYVLCLLFALEILSRMKVLERQAIKKEQYKNYCEVKQSTNYMAKI